jgi:hypothetical protein
MQPREMAQLLERRREVTDGRGERFAGYGLVGLGFGEGQILAFHRYTASSIGPPFTSIWRRSEGARWTIHSNVEPGRSCPRYYGPALDGARIDDIEVAWLGPREVSVTARHARLQLALRLAASPMTVALGAVARLLPRGVWRSPRLSRSIGAGAARLLGAGRLTLSGRVPAGQRFHTRPHAVWLVEAAAAVIGGRDAGAVTEIEDCARLGDLVIPRRGLFVFGETVFEGCAGEPDRHSRDALLREIVRSGRAAF